MKYLLGVVVILLAGCGHDPQVVNGINGTNGVDGYSSVAYTTTATVSQCSTGGSVILIGLDTNRNGQLDSEDTNHQSVVVCNGAKGDQGDDAPPSQFMPVGVIDPCGDAPNVFDEILLKLQDGTLLASFSENSNGKNTRFSFLVPGSYQTTDGTNCLFNVDQYGNVNW